MKRIALIFLIFALLSIPIAQAESVPPLVNYQGMLTDATGNAMTGTKTLTFNIYDAAIGGNLIWGPQVFTGVPLIGGRFNVILGTTDTAGRSIASAFGASNRFLGIKVDTGTELSPRQQILSTPFAIQAEHATTSDSALKSETVEGTNLYVNPGNGNVGIGTKNPNEKLEVIGTAKISGGLKPDYDSGWFHEDSSTTHVTTKTHNLGVYPSSVQIWFSMDNPPSDYIIAVPLTTYSQPGGIEAFRINPVKLEYSIVGGELIAHWWDGVTKSYTSGYYRILLWK